MKNKIFKLLFGIDKPLSIIPGLLLAAFLSIISYYICGRIRVLMNMKSSPVSMIMIGIILGLLVRNTIGISAWLSPGISFTTKKLLRLGIILMGMNLSIFAVAKIGVLAVGIVIMCISTGLIVTILVARKLKLSDKLGTLIALGTGICGVSAIAATAPAINAKEEEVSYAVSTITLFGMAALLVYPYITHLVLGLSVTQAGMFMGTAIHDTAQATGAGMMYDQLWMSGEKISGSTSMDIAVVTKLVRNTFMAVVIPLLAYIYNKKSGETQVKKLSFIKFFPLFVAGFIFLALIRSFGDYLIVQRNLIWNGDSWNNFGKVIQTWSGYFLAVAMVGVGLGTDFKRLRQLGIKPFLVGLFAALTVGFVSFILIKLFIDKQV